MNLELFHNFLKKINSLKNKNFSNHILRAFLLRGFILEKKMENVKVNIVMTFQEKQY